VKPIVECIPNFSEGRRTGVIDAIVQAIASVDGTKILHRTSDPDHNRTVITFVGEPQAVLRGAFVAIATASQLIDMDTHRGAHPRLGATDVVPLVPIQGITLAECALLADELAQQVARELHLPVYLYEASAKRPDRRNLADVRRGEYEMLKDTIHTPERLPDYGEPLLGKAGAVIIGARQTLIAFNVFLQSDDVRVAQAIAKAIRFSSGGLAGVKALGLLVNGKAQVSMNLTDYKRTPLHRVFEMIRREARYHGVQIHRSELIGLIPQDALLDVATWHLQLHDFDQNRILENGLFKPDI
jgi:glutamate formiminotransferase